MSSYGLKPVPELLRVLMRMLLSFHAIIVWVWHIKSGHTWTTEHVQYRLLECKEKFVYHFLYQLSKLEGHLVQQRLLLRI